MQKYGIKEALQPVMVIVLHRQLIFGEIKVNLYLTIGIWRKDISKSL